MSKKIGNFDQEIDTNLVVENDGATTLEEWINNIDNEGESADSSNSPEDIEAEKQYSSNIESKISAEIFMSQNCSQVHTYNNIPYGNTDTTKYPENNNDTIKCFKVKPSEDCHLPVSIYELFPDDDEQTISKRLIQGQEATDIVWKQIDENPNYKKTKEPPCSMRQDYNSRLHCYLRKDFSNNMVKKIRKAMRILDQSSFGLLILNSKNEILAVQNHNGVWSAIKGHLRIKEDGTLEIPMEAALREFFEELLTESIRSKRKRTISMEKMFGFPTLNNDSFIQCYVDSIMSTTARSRLIGLFIVRINEAKWKFTIKDTKENQACNWLSMNEILENGEDKYYTLRPFVEYLKEHPEDLPS